MRLSLYVLLAMVLATPVYAQQAPAQVQADTSYHLLWYKGKKLKPNVLLTPRLDTVTYIPAKGKLKVVSKAGVGRHYDLMLAEIARTPQRMKEKMSEFAARVPKTLVPHLAAPLERAYNQVMDDYKEILSNNIDLPKAFTIQELIKPSAASGITQQKNTALANDAASEKPVAAQQQSAGYAESGILTDVPLDANGAIILKPKDAHRLAQIREVLDYYERHKNDVINDVPQPPSYSLSYCTRCDSTYEQNWERQHNAFIEEMMGEDRHILQQIFSISRSAELFFYEELFLEVNRLIYPVLGWIMERADKRCRVLAKKYGEDPRYTRSVMSALLALDRQQQLMGFPQPDYFNGNAIIHSLEKTAEIYIKAMKEYDYSLLLDIERLLGMDRQFQLIGGKQPVSTYDVITFNQFKMEFQITGKAAGDKGYQLAELKGKNWYAAVPDQKTCKLNWILMGPNMNKLSAQLVAAEMKGGGGEINYVGTKSWEAVKPKMRIDFCEGGGTDTVEAYTFQAAGSTELWQYPAPTGVINMGHMNTILTGCFVDVQRTMEKAAYFKTPGNVDKMKQDMMKQYEAFMKNGGADMAKNASNMSPQDLQKMMKMANAMNASTRVSELVNTSNAASYLFKPAVRNKNKIVLKESLNGKELFPENSATVYA